MKVCKISIALQREWSLLNLTSLLTCIFQMLCIFNQHQPFFCRLFWNLLRSKQMFEKMYNISTQSNNIISTLHIKGMIWNHIIRSAQNSHESSQTLNSPSILSSIYNRTLLLLQARRICLWMYCWVRYRIYFSELFYDMWYAQRFLLISSCLELSWCVPIRWPIQFIN